jgi:hypothetical protein
MRRLLFGFISVMVFAVIGFAQDSSGKPAWNVTLPADKTAGSNITVQNRCSNTHSFTLERQSVPFLTISQNQVQVAGGANQIVPVSFNTTGLAPKTYQGQVLVVCLTCASEPTCSQDREVLPVVLTVTGTPKSTEKPADNDTDPVPSDIEKKDPCLALENRCDDLKAKAHRKEAEAAGAQSAADAAKTPADSAETKAKTAEQAAKDAEAAAKDDPSDYKAKVNEQDYSSADVAYRLVLQAEINRAQKAGEISNAEHKKQTEANTTKKARDERLKNLEQIGKEAAAAKKAADEARKAADEAKKVADAAQEAANAAKGEAEAARKAYDECIDKINEECKKIKAELARIEKEARDATDAAAAKLKLEEDRKKKAAADAQELLEKDKYLIDNIKKLGLIDSRLIGRDAPSIYQWLPRWLQTPVAMLVEAGTQTPIPIDALQAIARMYGLASSLLDPCTALGKRKTLERLNEMINPKTGSKYTDNEAFEKMSGICDLFARMRDKLEAIRKAQEMTK